MALIVRGMLMKITSNGKEYEIVPFANLFGADLYGANLSGANLFGASLRSADLRSADLRSANLRSADLSGADLYGANLSGANLSGADLYGANLSGANLSGANLFGANLYGADLSGAILPTHEEFETYLSEVVPALLKAGGLKLEQVATKKNWTCHNWNNCPMAEAFQVHSLSKIPVLFQPRAEQFIQLFDAGLIPQPMVK